MDSYEKIEFVDFPDGSDGPDVLHELGLLSLGFPLVWSPLVILCPPAVPIWTKEVIRISEWRIRQILGE